jgi:hypothetical protein
MFATTIEMVVVVMVVLVVAIEIHDDRKDNDAVQNRN